MVSDQLIDLIVGVVRHEVTVQLRSIPYHLLGVSLEVLHHPLVQQLRPQNTVGRHYSQDGPQTHDSIHGTTDAAGQGVSRKVGEDKGRSKRGREGRREGEREGKREGGNLTELQIGTVTVQKDKERVKVQHCF